jgi:hypothetical protein
MTCPNANDWGISYDDGPTEGTSGTVEVLEALEANNVKATFYVVGSRTISLPEIVKQEFDEGHEVSIHTWTHHPMTSLTNEQVIAELLYTEAIIFRTIGEAPRKYRPPYGDVDDRVRAIATALGFATSFWVTDSADTGAANPSAAQRAAVLATLAGFSRAGPGIITLQHDINPYTSGVTVDALNALPANPGRKPQPIGTCLGWNSFYKAKVLTGGGNGNANSSAGANPTNPGNNSAALGESTSHLSLVLSIAITFIAVVVV